jgi:hypothetical protein
VTKSSWQKSVRYRIGSWLISAGQELLRDAERREIVRRVAVRLGREPKGVLYGHSKDVAVDEITKFYTEKQRATE